MFSHLREAVVITHLLIAYLTLAANENFFTNRAPEVGNEPSSGSGNASNNSSLVWQPLRATFRPLNRQTPPVPPPPSPPEPLALVSEPAIASSPVESRFTFPSSLAALSALTAPTEASVSSPTTTTTVATTATSSPTTSATISPTTESPSASLDEEEQPTRVPLNRFRPTKSPSVDLQTGQPSGSPISTASGSHQGGTSHGNNQTHYRITGDCFECICEASTSCNVNSRCQTSDVRHTRCGMFLISYDQWQDTGLSKQLVTREALARDAAADERAFYECVTNRDCAERLLTIYMQRNGKDCDKDGRVDCYDIAAIHQGGQDHCSSEALLESQYWSDFNACFGFGRR